MTITPNQWLDTQNLLVLLAQALSPTAPLDLPERAAIANRIFANFYRPTQTRHTFEAKLLPTLKTAAVEMERLIENYCLQSETIAPIPKTSKPIETPPQRPQNQALPKHIGTEPQKLLQQVRISIGELSSSKYQELPPTLPLSILTKLKPMVDSYIQALSKQKLLPKMTHHSALKKPVQITTSEKKIFPFSPKNHELPPPKEPKPESPPPTRPALKGKQALADLKFIPATPSQNPKLPAPDIKPIIPFPTVYPLPASLTKKKKRKRYFFQDEAEDEKPKD